MRTTTAIYKFDELSEKAKERAIEEYRSDMPLAWQDEIIESVEAIAKAMNCRCEWYSYDGITYDVSFYSRETEDIENLTGKRAWAYIWNNYLYPSKEYKTYWKDGVIHCDGRKNWTRKSKISFGWDDCPFTGYIADCCFIEAWRAWKKNFNKYSSVGEFINLVAEKLEKEWTSENEYQTSDEGIIEAIEANDYEFLEDGTFYH